MGTILKDLSLAPLGAPEGATSSAATEGHARDPRLDPRKIYHLRWAVVGGGGGGGGGRRGWCSAVVVVVVVQWGLGGHSRTPKFSLRASSGRSWGGPA